MRWGFEAMMVVDNICQCLVEASEGVCLVLSSLGQAEIHAILSVSDPCGKVIPCIPNLSLSISAAAKTHKNDIHEAPLAQIWKLC